MASLALHPRPAAMSWRARRLANKIVGQNQAAKFRPIVDIDHAVERRCLVDIVLDAPPSSARVVIIAAPAGFGKTTLLAQTERVAHKRGERTFWMNCNTTDRHPADFLASLTLALAAGGLDVPGREGAGDVISSLAEAAGFCTLFIDQYEAAWCSEIDQLIEYFAATLGPRSRLVIAGRQIPVISLSQLQLRGAVRVVDADALRFSQDDTVALLGELVEPSGAQAWARYTDGWPFALQMVRLRSAAGSVPNVAQAGGQMTLAHIFDYLAHEVFSSVSSELGDFLIDCCILEDVDAAAADAIRQRDDSAVWLGEARSLRPIVLVSEAPLSARLHPLLRDFLRSRLERLSRARFTRLHANAAQLYAQRGNVFLAVAHAVQAGMLDFATNVILEAGAVRLLISEGSSRAKALLDLLPVSHVRSEPRLRLMLICIGLVDERSVDNAFDLSRLEATLSAEGPNDILDEAVRVDLAYVRSIVAIEESERTIEFHPWQTIGEVLQDARARFFEDPRYLCLCLPVEILFLQRYGRIGAARVRIDEFVEINASECFRQNAPWSIIFSALSDCAQGRLSEVNEALQRAVSSNVMAAEGQVRSFIQMLYATLGRARYGMGTLQDALSCFGHCEDSASTALVEVWEGGMLCAARAEFFLGKSDEALRRLSEARMRADVRNRYHLGLAATATLIELYVRLEEIPEAQRLANEIRLADQWQRIVNGAEAPWAEVEAIGQAHYWVLLASQAFGDAYEIAQAFEASAISRERPAAEARARLMKAHASMAGNLDRHPETDIARALDLTCGGGLQCFVEAGELVNIVVREIAESGTSEHREWAKRIVATWEWHFRERVSSSLLFTARERDVLAGLASGYTTKVIARNLSISPETVKQHLKSIFSKLDVTGRKNAVSEARRRAIVP
ncbi:LuxR C-terminal-related transcriptional regulator [Burkholderia sp. BCC0419]|uniref:helix-turn-helix transcriptional regulator n=1 Tax=Burkholderia sp. BCC0419 TaxID=486878 RepID=UPI001589A277|nr:LuxR C-terminal-related transcriptional regulator [Burkholderia sp. BCC0419]